MLAYFSFTACDKVGDNSSVVIKLDPYKTTVNIIFLNAKTQIPIGYEDVKKVRVQIFGANANQVHDISGVTQSSYYSARGFMTLGIEKSVKPTPANPFKFTIVAEAEGYVSTSVPMNIVSESHGSIQVQMVEISNPSKGIASIVNTDLTVDHGVVNSTVLITTPVVATTNTKAVLTIPQNTIIKDASGTPLEGNITTTMVYFNNIDDESIQCFPGGLMANVVQNGVEKDVMFYSAGFVAIEMTDGSGRKAKSFENNQIQVCIEVPLQTYNPVTNTTIQVGDEIPLWSYEPSTGQWNYEGQMIIYNQNGSYIVNGFFSHLSYWNWDWGWGDGYCEYGCQLHFISNTYPAGYPVGCYFLIHRQSDGVLLDDSRNHWGSGMFGGGTGSGTMVLIGETVQFWRVSSGIPVVIEARDYWYNTTIGAQLVNDLCSGTYDFELTPPQLPPSDSVVVKLNGYCPSSPNDTVYPSLGYYYKNITRNGPWLSGYMVNGNSTLYNMILGDTYKFGTTFNGVYEQYDMTIVQSGFYIFSVQFTQAMCDEIVY
jgi:hypothetical protein